MNYLVAPFPHSSFMALSSSIRVQDSRTKSPKSHSTMLDDDPMSDDGSASIDTVPGPGLTEELRALHQKIHEERTDGMFLQGRMMGPPRPPTQAKNKTYVGRPLKSISGPRPETQPYWEGSELAIGNAAKERGCVQAAFEGRDEAETKRTGSQNSQERPRQEKVYLCTPKSPLSQVIN